MGVVSAVVWAALRAPIAQGPDLEDVLTVAQTWPTRPWIWIDHLADSPIGLLLGRALGVTDVNGLMRLSAVSSALALAGLTAWVAVVSSERSLHAARLFILSPIVAVLLFWLGFHDAYTTLAWALALFAWLSNRPWFLTIAAIPLGIQHFQIAFLGSVALLLVWYALREQLPNRVGRISPVWITLGVVAGKAVLIAVFLASGQAADARGIWLETYFVQWTKVAVVTAPMLLWSLFAGLWPLVISTWMRSTGTRQRALLFSAFFVGSAATLVSGDRPRVFVLVLAPALMLAIAGFASSPNVSRGERVMVESVAWLAPPILLAGVGVANTNVVDLTVPTVIHLLGIG